MDATVVIPTFNRKDALLQTLDHISKCDYQAHKWEVLVVDDGSTDGTREAVEEWIRASAAPVRLITQPNQGPASARNHGAAEGKGANLIFVDNDILVGPSFIDDHLRALSLHPGSWVVGRIVNMDELRLTPFGRYRDRVWESYYRCFRREGVQLTVGITGQSLSLSASDFRKLSGFDESFRIASCEDWELGLRARRAGISVLYEPSIVAKHNDWAISLRRFCERQMLYSISDVLLFQKYGDDSPRASLVRENSPVDWRTDPVRLIVKKTAKRLLALAPLRTGIEILCRVTEQVAPDTELNRRAYDLAVAVAIFAGVREGLSRYFKGTGLTDNKTKALPICRRTVDGQ
jgi:GT2 family glycosyltransferase